MAKTIPVSEARRLSSEYDRRSVIIVGLDSNASGSEIHVVTYGRGPQDKILAAELGTAVARALGAIVQSGIATEDFRNLTQAEYAVEIDRLKAEIDLLRANGDRTGP